MATTKTIQATVKNRTDTAANWTQKNPVLAEGEIIVIQTSAGETRLKIGDGVKTFTQLPYTDEQIYNNVVTSVNGQTGDVTLDIPGGIFEINVTDIGNEDDDGKASITLDKTYAEIKAAIENGKTPILIVDGVYRLPLSGISEGQYYFETMGDWGPPRLTYYAFAVTKNGSFGVGYQIEQEISKAIKYTPQELTGDEKKQARENIGAEENHNGLLKKDLYYQLQTSFNKNPFIMYIKEGDITQFSDSEPNQSDIRKAFVFLALVMGKAGGQEYNNSDFQAHTKQLYAAYQTGLLQLPLTCYANPYNNKIQLINITYVSDYFNVKVVYEDGSGFNYGYQPSTDTFVDGTYTGYLIHERSNQALTVSPSVRQFSMSAAPAKDMQIATKKYVDDKISDKEIILSSSTAGSTKKFKLTIDDTGTLTASEITT